MTCQTHERPPDPLHVLSMGGGVQTTTILLLACHEVIEKPHHVVMADLNWEPPAVARNITWLHRQAQRAGIPFHVIQTGDVRDGSLCLSPARPDLARYPLATMPLFTLDSHGRKGMLPRRCTQHYKIRPIDAFIRQDLLGLSKHAKCPPFRVRLQFGISTDEENRTHPNKPAWKQHDYPLIDLGMSRQDCYDWLLKHNYHRPARSSCVGCPYRSDAEWYYLKLKVPSAFAEAVQFDQALRTGQPIKAQLYLHRSRKPLPEVDFQTRGIDYSPERDNQECWGYCGS